MIEYRWAAGKAERLPDLAAELVRLKPDVLVAAATPPIRAAKRATTSIPIVMAAAADPVGSGLVDGRGTADASEINARSTHSAPVVASGLAGGA